MKHFYTSSYEHLMTLLGRQLASISTVLDGRMSPGYGKTAGTGQGGSFSLSGRHSAIADGILPSTNMELRAAPRLSVE